MWAAFVGSDSPAAVSASDASYTAWQFGHGPEMADELLSVVLIGRKRATTGALRSYELEGEPVPRPGDFSVITDGRGIAGASSGPRRWTSARSTRSTPPTPVTKARATCRSSIGARATGSTTHSSWISSAGEPGAQHAGRV